jgi:DNA-binding transcriptional ArsR family regulator
VSVVPNISRIAGLIGEPSRAAILIALLDGRALPATELARAAGVGGTGASNHLAKLVGAKLLEVEVEGRHRYYRLARSDVAAVIEVSRNWPVSPPGLPWSSSRPRRKRCGWRVPATIIWPANSRLRSLELWKIGTILCAERGNVMRLAEGKRGDGLANKALISIYSNQVVGDWRDNVWIGLNAGRIWLVPSAPAFLRFGKRRAGFSAMEKNRD